MAEGGWKQLQQYDHFNLILFSYSHFALLILRSTCVSSIEVCNPLLSVLFI